MKTDRLFVVIFSFLLIYCGGCRPEKDTVRIATKPMTEQFILGEMLGLMIEAHTDLKVKITKGIGGGTSNIHPALLKGEFDLYPEYTGTGWLVVLKKDTLLPPDELFRELNQAYQQKYHLKWLAPYGFNNTYGLAVRPEKARQYGLKNFSDVARYPNEFIFGAEYDFYEIHKGYDALCRFYKIKFKKTRDMDIGLKYEAIKSGKIDVMNIFTTDGQLGRSNLTVLEDDKHFFPSYHCATVVREATLAQYPELAPVLEKMKNILTNEEMSALNYQVDLAGASDQEVAKQFLQQKGLIP